MLFTHFSRGQCYLQIVFALLKVLSYDVGYLKAEVPFSLNMKQSYRVILFGLILLLCTLLFVLKLHSLQICITTTSHFEEL
jgi:hypothetical protein